MSLSGSCGTIPETRQRKEAAIPRKPHVRIEYYVLASQHPRGAADLMRQMHEHVVDRCPVCEEEWKRLGNLRQMFLEEVAELRLPDDQADPPVDHLSGAPDVLREDEEAVQELLALRHRVVKEKCELLSTPREERIRKIQRAHRRFRSLLLAGLLIEECRSKVRSDPVEASHIAELVRHVLAWTRDWPGMPHAPALLARAAAHRANALRVAGDLPAAERAFIELRRNLAEEPLDDPRAVAEVASLEASLCIDQRRLDEAEEHLAHAMLAARHAGDRTLQARVLVKQANLMRTGRRPEEMGALLATAADHLDSKADPELFLCTVTGRVNALCELNQPLAARRLLVTHLNHFEASPEPHTGALYRCLEGRCALALGELHEAEACFQASRDGHLALGRIYDAALADLYLAETLYVAGKHAELRRHVAQLVRFFRSRGVEGEALAAIQLLARSLATEAVQRRLFARVRDQVAAAAVAPL